MNIIEINLLMDTGLGVDPEVLIFKEHNNFITIRLSKKFKCQRHYQEFDIAHPSINKKYTQELEEKIKYYIEMLQRYIGTLNKE